MDKLLRLEALTVVHGQLCPFVFNSRQRVAYLTLRHADAKFPLGKFLVGISLNFRFNHGDYPAALK
jgi:hypothetical protein